MLEFLQIIYRRRIWLTVGVTLAVVLMIVVWFVAPRKIKVSTILEIPQVKGGVIPVVAAKNMADIRELIRGKYAPLSRPSFDKLPITSSLKVRYDPRAISIITVEIVVEKGYEGSARQWLEEISQRVVGHFEGLLKVQERAYAKMERDYEEVTTRLERLSNSKFRDAGNGRDKTAKDELAVQQWVLMQLALRKQNVDFLRELSKSNFANAQEEAEKLAIVTEHVRGTGVRALGAGLIGIVLVFISAVYRDFWIRNRAAIIQPPAKSK